VIFFATLTVIYVLVFTFFILWFSYYLLLSDCFRTSNVH